MDGISGPQQKGDAIDQKLAQLKAQREQGSVSPSDPGLNPIDVAVLPQGGPTAGGKVGFASPLRPHFEAPEPEKRGLLRPIGITLILLSLIAAGLFAFAHFGQKTQTGVQLDASNKYSTQASPEPSLTAKLSSINQSNTLTVNGSLSVTGSLILSPSVKPPAAVAGELYYDSSKNLVGYFDGTTFVYPQGGGNVTNNTTINNITNPAVTNVTNVTNITGGGMTGTGTPGQLAMFTGPSALGDSLINQNGSSLNTGTGVESVTLGSQTGTSDTTLQGGNGNVTINTGASSTGSSGSITIQSGSSATTAAGNITIDTGNSTLSGTVVSSKDFEDGLDDMYNGVFNGNTTTAQTTAQAELNTHSLAVTVGSFGFPYWAIASSDGNPPYQIPAVAGHTYAFQAWVRADTNSDTITGSVIWSNDGYAGGGEISQQNYGSTTDVTTGWRKIAGVLTAPVNSCCMALYFSGNATAIGEIHYFDNITVTDLSNSSAAAAIDIGATNAQVITIGNSAMFAPTSIFGGGINLAAGTGILNLSGSTIVAASGGANYTTTSGALDLTSATTALWKVNGSGGTGYDLNLQAGDAGGINVANGGNLYLQGGAGAAGGSGGGVIVKPQTDSPGAFQVQNAGGSSIINVDTQTQLINDPMVTNAPTGTLSGSASWVNGNYLDLNNTSGEDGDVNYTASPGTAFDATFNFWAASGGADSTYFYAYNTSVPTNPNGYATASGGYIFNYDEFHGDAEIWFDGTELANAPVSGIASSSWHSAEIIRSGNNFTMKMDGSTVLTFTDIPRVLAGENFGIGGYSGAFAGEHRTDDFVLSIGTAPAILTVNATAQFNSDLTVAGTITTPNITVQALAVTATLTVNGHIVSGGTAIATFSPGSAAACSGGDSVGVTGNDVSGTISITTGAGPCSSSGGLIDVNFASSFTAAPHVILTPAEPNAATLQYYYTSSTTGFTVSTGNVPTGATTYNYAYLIVQ
jgi:hypothetical protein